jgi:hypothetical protein
MELVIVETRRLGSQSARKIVAARIRKVRGSKFLYVQNDSILCEA